MQHFVELAAWGLGTFAFATVEAGDKSMALKAFEPQAFRDVGARMRARRPYPGHGVRLCPLCQRLSSVRRLARL